MYKSQNRTACKTDILKTDPDICQHTQSRNNNCHKSILSHFRTYCRRNTFCGDQSLVYIKIINHCLIEFFSFRLRQSTCLNNHLVCSHNLGRLYVFISGYFFYNRCYLRVNFFDIHVLIKGNCSCSSAGKFQTVIQNASICFLMDHHGYRSHKNQNQRNNKENIFLSNKIDAFSLLCSSVEFFILNTYRIQSIYDQS